MMKKIITILFINFLVYNQAQIKLTNYNDALKMGKELNKFIIIDFTASWCGPCQVMKREFWNNKEVKDSLKQFILVEIDVDNNKNLASKYSITTIPNVYVIDAWENELYNETGYNGVSSVLQEFLGYPKDISNLYQAIEQYQSTKNIENTQQLALAYQESAKKSYSTGFTLMLKKSNLIFNDLQKLMKKEKTEINLVNEAFLQQQENNLLDKKYKKIIKEVLPEKTATENLPFAHYLLYTAHINLKQTEEAQKHYNKLIELNDGVYSEKVKN